MLHFLQEDRLAKLSKWLREAHFGDYLAAMERVIVQHLPDWSILVVLEKFDIQKLVHHDRMPPSLITHHDLT